MKVWVVMRDDSPKKVFVSEEKANIFVQQHQGTADAFERARYPLAYWRMHLLELVE